MPKGGRLVVLVASAALLAVAGTLAATNAMSRSEATPANGRAATSGPPAAPSLSPTPTAPSPALDPSTVLVWASGSLPDGFPTAVAALPEVRRAVTVFGGVVWMTRSVGADGSVVDAPPSGMAIPIDVAAADPAGYAGVLPANERWIADALASGRAVLGSTSARLRRLSIGGTLAFGSHQVEVAGVAPDQAVGAAEVLVSRTTAARLGVTLPRWLLVIPAEGVSLARLQSAMGGAVPDGIKLVIRTSEQTPFLRYGDAVLAPAMEKELAGEFAGSPQPDGSIVVDQAWVRANIETTDVPILGRVTCNRVTIPPLRAALEQVVHEGLSRLVDPGQYAGCYVPRYIGRTADRPLSHHAWGTALDINVASNRMGAAPHQDPRLVAIFEQHGFTWGGRWIVPDGMHFELRPAELYAG